MHQIKLSLQLPRIRDVLAIKHCSRMKALCRLSQTVIPEEDQPEMIEKIAKGNFTMRIMYEQFQNLTKMGPMSQVCSPALRVSPCPDFNPDTLVSSVPRSAPRSAALVLSPA